ncbi:sin3 histone deacetylase corepressor complex component SDS3-like isoform X2 [Liolophura sinensis]|uniref:sin3 histone deacetylase corepressor complex component SDS3-like isoform X2 n=1 Tax=Liolophura sinensis TaxID=3198878 RepID=UPI003159732F
MSLRYSSSLKYSAYDFDDNGSGNSLDDGNASDEDTEEASEGEMPKTTEYTEIKEQMYQDKLAQFKKQLAQLKEGTLPEYIKRHKKIDQQYKERLRMNEIWRNYEDKKIDLKESLIMELEEKKRSIEAEHVLMELTGDPMEVKPVMTRKLRRRPNDPVPLPEKRRKASPTQINFFLDEMEIMEDLKIINKVSGKPIHRKPNQTPTMHLELPTEARIDDGRLYYDKRWFHRGQAVYAESKDTGRVSGVICAVGTQEIYIRKTTDNSKLRIYLSQLQKGKFTIRRRST